MPHILLVVDQLPRSLGGGERVVLKIAELLPAYGYRASLLTFAADPESPALVDPPCAIYLLPLTSTYDWNALKGAVALRRFLKRERVALVHTFFESSDLWAGLVTKLTSSAKLVWNRRDMGILRAPKHTAAYRFAGRWPDAVFAVSEQVRRYTIEVDGVAPERVMTVYNGLELSRWPGTREAGAANERAPVIATLGNIRRVKGHDVLLRAFAVVLTEFPEATLALGGAVLEPEFMAELDALAAELGIAARLQFRGSIRDQRGFLEEADLFVLPSRSEGFSNAVIEAMASSLPVVATDVGGNREAIAEGETGYVVPTEDIRAMAEAMLRVLRDPALARRLGEAGRQRVVSEFTTEAMMQRMVTQFDRLLSGS